MNHAVYWELYLECIRILGHITCPDRVDRNSENNEGDLEHLGILPDNRRGIETKVDLRL